jgi:small conductance mechanosensitive channel
MNFLVNYGLKILGSVLLLVVCWKLIGVLIKLIKKSKPFEKVDEGAKSFLLTCVSVVLRVLLVLTVAANLGVPMTNVAAIVASCGLAVGLALQGSLSNFAGGVMLLLFHPFRIGDYIEANGKEGTVKSISLMSTMLTTGDNRDIIVPNGTMIGSIITNYSTEATRRVDLDFAVAYGTDEEKVKKVLLLMAEKHELALKDPAPFARLTKQADSALIFTLRVWCKKEDYWTVRLDLLEQVNAAFQKVDIVVPFNQLDVHLDK